MGPQQSVWSQLKQLLHGFYGIVVPDASGAADREGTLSVQLEEPQLCAPCSNSNLHHPK